MSNKGTYLKSQTARLRQVWEKMQQHRVLTDEKRAKQEALLKTLEELSERVDSLERGRAEKP